MPHCAPARMYIGRQCEMEHRSWELQSAIRADNATSLPGAAARSHGCSPSAHGQPEPQGGATSRDRGLRFTALTFYFVSCHLALHCSSCTLFSGERPLIPEISHPSIRHPRLIHPRIAHPRNYRKSIALLFQNAGFNPLPSIAFLTEGILYLEIKGFSFHCP